MKKTFVIISVSDRVEQLNELVKSICDFPKFKDYDINLLYQDYLGNADKIKYRWRYANIFTHPEKLGCHGARVALLREIEKKGSYDVYINLDDDMLLTEYTDYSKPIEKALEQGTGFVLTNWARTESLMLSKVPKMQDTFVKQALIYQGGGMVYANKIAKLMANLEVTAAMFDDIWPLTSYINGYTNYRYLGSLAIHSICTKGGMHLYMQENKLPLLCKEYINYRYCKDGKSVHIPMDSDLNETARNLHKQNYKGVVNNGKKGQTSKRDRSIEI